MDTSSGPSTDAASSPEPGADARPLVFVTVGTDHHPFDRVVGWVDRWLEQRAGTVRCLLQYGTSTPPAVAEGVDYLAFDRMMELLEGADVVVTHGGTGSVMLCRKLGRTPVVVPRTHRLGEHVDDHQLPFARRMGDTGDVAVAETEEQFGGLLDEAVAMRGAGGKTGRRHRVDTAAREAVARFDALVTPLLAPPTQPQVPHPRATSTTARRSSRHDR